jgi:hypothetical protein
MTDWVLSEETVTIISHVLKARVLSTQRILLVMHLVGDPDCMNSAAYSSAGSARQMGYCICRHREMPRLGVGIKWMVQ